MITSETRAFVISIPSLKLAISFAVLKELGTYLLLIIMC